MKKIMNDHIIDVLKLYDGNNDGYLDIWISIAFYSK